MQVFEKDDNRGSAGAFADQLQQEIARPQTDQHVVEAAQRIGWRLEAE